MFHNKSGLPEPGRLDFFYYAGWQVLQELDGFRVQSYFPFFRYTPGETPVLREKTLIK